MLSTKACVSSNEFHNFTEKYNNDIDLIRSSIDELKDGVKIKYIEALDKLKINLKKYKENMLSQEGLIDKLYEIIGGLKGN